MGLSVSCCYNPPVTRKGIYVLIIHVPQTVEIHVGRLGIRRFRAGYYAYVGSALNSLDTRLMRHCGLTKKKVHWHIDYLLRKGQVIRAYVKETLAREECIVAKAMADDYPMPVKGFGASDCRCRSHLFYIGSKLPAKFASREAVQNKITLSKWEPGAYESSSPRRRRTTGGR